MPSQITLLSKDNKQIPLKKVNVEVDTVGLVSQFTIHQTYFNDEDKPLEVTYTFPTPAGATVYDFQAVIDDKVVKCIIKEKEKAREDYSKAVSSGDGAYLMEQVSGDAFNCSIGNIPPKKEVSLRIRYVLQVQSEVNARKLRLNFPLTIMPRYTPVKTASHSNATNSSITSGGPSVNNPKVNFKPYEFALSGTMFMPEGIDDVKCSSHTFTDCIVTENACTFNIESLESLDKDLIIHISRGKPSTIAIEQKMDGELNDEMFRYCTMMNIVPDFDAMKNIDARELHYTFILDRSGSMEGTDLENCKEAASTFVSMLPIGATFDIYHFGSDFKRFIKSQSENEQTTKQRAVAWIKNITSDGGTELTNVLTDAFESIKQKPEKQGIIVLLSDGGVSNTDDVIRLCSSYKDVRVFTIGIGDSVSQELIQGLAEAGKGKAEFVASRDKDAIVSKVTSQLLRSQSKVSMKNLVDVECASPYTMTPTTLQTIYNADCNIIYIFSAQPISSLLYEYDDEKIQCEIIREKCYEGNPIHRIAGNDLIKTIKSRKSKTSHLYYVPQTPILEEIKKEIIKVSKNLNILSEHTSFIGVEYRYGSDKTLDESVFKEIPLQVAQKYNVDSVDDVFGFGGGGIMISGNCTTFSSPSSMNPMHHNNMVPFFGSQSNQQAKGSQSNQRFFNSQLKRGFLSASHHAGGINFVGQTLKNANYDISSSLIPQHHSFESTPDSYDRGTSNNTYKRTRDLSSFDVQNDLSFEEQRYNKPTTMSFYCDEGEGELSLDLFGDRNAKKQDSSLYKVPQPQKYNIKATVEKLNDCYFVNNKLLTSTVNCTLDKFLSETIEVNDFIVVKDSKFLGVYKVVSIGSDMTPWVLERVTSDLP